MGELPQLTRSLAQKLSDLEHVDEVVDKDTSKGKVSFRVRRSLSSSRIGRLLPYGCDVTVLISGTQRTTVYIER